MARRCRHCPGRPYEAAREPMLTKVERWTQIIGPRESSSTNMTQHSHQESGTPMIGSQDPWIFLRT